MPATRRSPGARRTTRGSATAVALASPSGLLAARTSVPASPAGMVGRPSLYSLLDRAAAGRLTVVTAGPGWGKTCTVADWASRLGDVGHVAWLSLASTDDSPAAFWTAALHAARAGGRIRADHPLARLSPADDMSTDMMQYIYDGFRALTAPIVLVLDDFHVLNNSAVLDSVAELLRGELPVGLVLLTRSDPVLPVHRLRLSGELTEIVADDLAFSLAEITALTEAAGLELSRPDLERIRARTDGWPAGVRLAILHLCRDGSPEDLSWFGGTDRSVAEYLVAEVLDRQTPQLRDFLLHTSVVSLVCADLADAIAPGSRSQEYLEYLEQSNQFVTGHGPDRRWFRYHPLLRELLEHALTRDEPDQYRAAHARAARWLAWHGEPVTALAHAAHAKDWTLLSTIFVQSAAPAGLGPDRDVVAGLLAAVPFDDISPTAPLAVCAGALSFLHGRMAALSEHVESARALLSSTPTEIRSATAAVIELIACAAARARSDAPTMTTTARGALSQLDQVSRPFPALPSLRAIAAGNLAVGLLWSGQTQAARTLFSSAGAAAEAAETYLPAINAWAHLGLCELAEGRLGEAEAAAARALGFAASRGVTSRFQIRPAHITLAYLDLLRGNTDGADRRVASGLTATDGASEPAPAMAVYICAALAAVSRRRTRTAEQALAAARTSAMGWNPPRFLNDWLIRAATETSLLTHSPDELAKDVEQLQHRPELSPTAQVCLSRLLLATGDAHGAEVVARGGCDPSTDGAHVDRVTELEAWLVRALAADHLRHDHESLKHLSHALELAGPERLLRPFLVTRSERLAILLHSSIAFGPQPVSPSFSRDLLQHLQPQTSDTTEPEHLEEPLTDRELTVLAALPMMHTNAEIAEHLSVSVNTVKAHLKNLYRKLRVSTRRDAIRRAKTLGLLQ